SVVLNSPDQDHRIQAYIHSSGPPRSSRWISSASYLFSAPLDRFASSSNRLAGLSTSRRKSVSLKDSSTHSGLDHVASPLNSTSLLRTFPRRSAMAGVMPLMAMPSFVALASLMVALQSSILMR